jgi:hypothetical protein
MSGARSAAAALIDILMRENAALSAMDLTGATTLLSAKQAATETLARAGEATDLDPDTAARLRAVARENQALLTRALTVQARVIALIAGAGAEVPPASRYGAAGTMTAARHIAPRALSARA